MFFPYDFKLDEDVSADDCIYDYISIAVSDLDTAEEAIDYTTNYGLIILAHCFLLCFLGFAQKGGGEWGLYPVYIRNVYSEKRK